MAVLWKKNVAHQRQLLAQASTDPALIQNTCKASASQNMAALEKLAKSLTSAQTAPSAPTKHLPNFREGEDKHVERMIQEAVNVATTFQGEQTPSKNVNREPNVPQPLLKGPHKGKTTESKELPGRRWRALWPSNSGEGSTAQCYECQALGHRAATCPQRQTKGCMETGDSGVVPSSAIGPFIKTFIFLDLETTGLPRDRPKVTELCLVAVHHTSLENPVRHITTGHPTLPRIVDKLCLIIDPGKPVTPRAAELTGLNNSNVTQNEKPNFDEYTMALIHIFLQRQTQPVCLVAHNGYNFDFPLLKTELRLQGRELPGSVYCLDTMQALKGLHQNPGANPSVVPSSYSLPLLYKHFFKEEPQDSHYAEGDVMTMLLIFLNKALDLLEYARTHTRPWTEVQPMYTPVIPQTP